MPYALAAPSAANSSTLRIINGVEIFRAGKWNGDDYSVADLDEMVNAFGAVGYQVPLKVGLNPGDLGHAEGGPAFGYVDRIYRVGDVLCADFRDIPEWLFSRITQDHAYDHVSSEVYWNLHRDEKVFKRALKAVALLGAETPAVSGLKRIREAYFDASAYEKVTCATLEVSKPMPAEPKAPTQAEFEALQAQLAAANAQVTKLAQEKTDASAQVSTLSTTVQSLQASVATMAAEQARAANDARVKKCAIPALHEPLRHLYAMATSGENATKTVKFSGPGADGKVAVTDRSLEAIVDDVVAHINKFADNTVGTGTAKRHSARPADDNAPKYSGDASKEVSTRVKKYMADQKIPRAEQANRHGEALRAVLSADPDLADAYGDFTRNGPAN
jgi:hypothetical protein